MGKPTNFVAALRRLVQQETHAQMRELLRLPPRAVYRRRARQWRREGEDVVERKFGTGR